MYFVFVKLIDITYKEDVILALRSVGVEKASYIESTNLERTLSDEFRLFTGFLGRDKNEGQQGIITALVEEKEQILEFLDNLRQAEIDVDTEEILRVNAWPVSLVFDSELGLKEFDEP